MDIKKNPINNLDQEIRKDQKSSKDSLAKEILDDENEYTIYPNEVEYGQDHTNEQDHHQKRTSGVKKGFCDQNKCDVYFE